MWESRGQAGISKSSREGWQTIPKYQTGVDEANNSKPGRENKQTEGFKLAKYTSSLKNKDNVAPTEGKWSD